MSFGPLSDDGSLLYYGPLGFLRLAHRLRHVARRMVIAPSSSRMISHHVDISFDILSLRPFGPLKFIGSLNVSGPLDLGDSLFGFGPLIIERLAQCFRSSHIMRHAQPLRSSL